MQPLKASEIASESIQAVERRETRRHARSFGARVRESGQKGHCADVIDISREGCAVRTSALSGNPERPIWLRLGDVSSLRADLVWNDNDRAGLKFETPLHQAVLDQLVEPQDNCAAEQGSPDNDASSLPDDLPQTREQQIKSGYTGQPLLKRKKPIGDKPFESLIEREIKRNAEHRLEARFPIENTNGPAYVTVREASAQLHNISPSGISFVSEFNKGIGDPVEIKFLNCEPIRGQVIWRKDTRYGVVLPENSIIIEDHD